MKRFITWVLIVVILFINCAVVSAGSSRALLSREEFDRWMEHPEYTIFNPFPSKGKNCTWYAHGRMLQLGYCPESLNSMRFNAYTWADSAAWGAQVSHSPQAHSIAFWQAGAFYGSLLGHVAVVEEVREDGSILISDSSSSGSPYRTYSVRPGEERWPTSFIIVPQGPGRSVRFTEGQRVTTTADNLNFRLSGNDQPVVLLPERTLVVITGHRANGLYAPQPGSVTSYHNWWFATVLFDGISRTGWLAETYLSPEINGLRDSGVDNTFNSSNTILDEELEQLNSEDEHAQIIPGDINGDGRIDITDVSLLMRHIILKESLNDKEAVAADYNSDGVVNIKDASLAMRFILGLIDS